MSQPIVIVGAGMAGLSAARHLSVAGEAVLVLDAADRPGGRLKTDELDGFRLDRGFQVYFTAYPQGKKLLDYDRLKLCNFEPGALVWDGRRVNEIHRAKPAAMALSGYLTVRNKLKLLEWNKVVDGMNVAQIWEMPDGTTESHLLDFGFTNEFLVRFARPFFGGIFLDRSLQTSRRMLTFVWKMLLDGDTAIPAAGIEAIPRQLAATLPADALRMNSPVARVILSGGSASGVELASGELIQAKAVVVATDAPALWSLAGIQIPQTYRQSTCIYFHAPEPPVGRRMLVLNGSETGIVNHIVPCSVVTPQLVPRGEHLVSATILGEPTCDDAELADRVLHEIEPWFPDARISRWRTLRIDRVRQAQLNQPPHFRQDRPDSRTATPGLYLAGEFTESSSIDGALRSGKDCARTVRADQ